MVERPAVTRRLSLPVITPLPAASDAAFERFVRLVRRQLGVPVALVSLVDQEQQVFPGAQGLPEPWQTTRRTPLTHSFCQHVVTGARPLVIEDARDDPRVEGNLAIPELGVVAYAGMPLTDADGRVVGSLCAIDSRPRLWSDDDVAVLADLAEACSSELQLRAVRDRASRAARLAAAKWRHTEELLEERRSAAETLQRAMLTRLPEPRSIELAARYVPAHLIDQVGGDWYDAFGDPEDVTTLVIGDTAGHDISAAADMSQLRTLLRGYAVDRDERPSSTMRRLDRAMSRLGMRTIASVVLATVEADVRRRGWHRMRWTNAGHPPPLLLHPDGRLELLATRPDVVVGVDDSWPRRDHVVQLEPGSTVLLYTDGLIEQRSTGRSIDEGIDLLVDDLRRFGALPLEELLDRLVGAGRTSRDDDIAVLGMRTRST
jgi:serine phosphatase RsbU (regulator of sigma subunit)